MLGPNFSSVLYPYSPFLPPIDTPALWDVSRLIAGNGYHPAVAIAYEIRSISSHQIDIIEAESDWIIEKFAVDNRDIDLYFYGLILPPSMIVAADMMSFLSPETILNYLFSPSDDKELTHLRSYGKSQLDRVHRLIDLTSPDPLISADPIYSHCNFEVFSDSRWYGVGMEASRRIYTKLARVVQ